MHFMMYYKTYIWVHKDLDSDTNFVSFASVHVTMDWECKVIKM